MNIIFWIPALGIARLTLVLSPLITIRAINESHYAYWVFERGRDPVNSDSFINIRFIIGPR